MVPTGQVLSQTSRPLIIHLHIYPLTPFHFADKNTEAATREVACGHETQ